MTRPQDIWTIIETYSFVQGLFLALYALVILRKSFLAALLFSISVLIAGHLYYHFEWYYINPHFIFAEAPFWYLIGPLFYLFTLRFFNRSIHKLQILHFIPVVVFLIYVFPFYFESGAEKLLILESLFGEETYSIDYNRYIFSAHIFIYILLTYFTFRRQSEQLKQESSRSTLILDSIMSIALKYYLLFSVVGLVAYLIVGDNYEWSNVYYDFYYVGLSLLIHCIFYFSLVRAGSGDIDDDSLKAEKSENGKYSSSSLSSHELQEIIEQVQQHISQFEVYRNPELRLRMISDDLEIPAHHISQAVNQELGKSFFDLVNEQRIEGLKQHIDDPRYRNYTLVGIASEHGFKSSSSFYRIFKKFTGKTPKEYFSKD